MKTLAHIKSSTNVRLPPELKGKLVSISERNNMSLSDVVRLSLMRFLPEMEAGEFRLSGIRVDAALKN